MHKTLWNDTFFNHLKLYPQIATQVGLATEEQKRLLDRYTYKHFETELELIKDTLIGISMIDEELEKNDLLHNEVFEWCLNTRKEGLEKKYYKYSNPICIQFGPLSYISSTLIDQHKIETDADYQSYLYRLRQITVLIDDIIEFMNNQVKEKIYIPTVLVERTLGMLKDFVSVSAEEHIFYKSAVKKNSKYNYNSVIEILKTDVYPSYARLIKYLTKYRFDYPETRIGVWRFNDPKYYQYVLKDQTTTNFKPKELHAIGLNQIDKIKKKMEALVEKPFEYLKKISSDDTYQFKKGDENLYKYCQDLSDKYYTKMNKVFKTLPKNKIEVREVPNFMKEHAGTAYYYEPSIDGTRNGVYYINNSIANPKYELATLTAHEAIPGHHFERSLCIENLNLPLFRRSYGMFNSLTAYIEGWALYSEKLAYEMGLFETTEEKLGYYASSLFRAVRLVIDTGIHEFQWSRKKAIEEFTKYVPLSKEVIEMEVDRYISYPGQACAYKIGEIAILILKNESNKMNLKDFHEKILRNGPIPITLLNKHFNSN